MQKHWGSCYYMSPYDTMEKKGMVISTFGSTDIGVSFTKGRRYSDFSCR